MMLCGVIDKAVGSIVSRGKKIFHFLVSLRHNTQYATQHAIFRKANGKRIEECRGTRFFYGMLVKYNVN